MIYSKWIVFNDYNHEVFCYGNSEFLLMAVPMYVLNFADMTSAS